MSTQAPSRPAAPTTSRSAPPLNGLAARAHSALAGIAGGALATLPVTLRFWDGSELPGPAGAPACVVRRPVALAYLLHEPNQLGLARAWVTGSLDVDGDIEAVLATRHAFDGVHVTARDRARLALEAVRAGGRRVLLPPPVPDVEAPRRHGRRHSRARDRTSVRHHYDVSNRFYQLVLGPTMVYSCAYFASPDDSLEAAQERKLELICRKLALQPGERLLDIGSGWGSLLIHAAREHGVRGVGVTLSEPQVALARERIRAAGLEDRVEVRVADYRELRDGPFDKVASVGMYEHVGRSELETYVRKVHELLRPGGLFLNHGITQLDATPPDDDTLISRYVFPDGELHPVNDVLGAMQASDFELRDAESLREHYPLTLRAWVRNLMASWDACVAEVGEARARVWQLYMVGSAQAFEAAEISVYQVLAARGGAPHGLPLRRTELLAGI